MHDRLLSVREAAETLGVGQRTVERLLASGELPRVKVRARTLIDPQDLRGFVARHRSGSLAGASLPGGRITAGQNSALHAKAGELDRADREERGTWKRHALAAASRRFGREIVSARELSHDEAVWVLDMLEEELQRR
jgi:excisionase family DNA binding protein